jgi:hypothetical protein
MKRIRQAVFLLPVLLALSLPTLAQLSTGSMSGTITDASGAAVPNAKVTARQDNTGLTIDTVTTDAGLYVFPNLNVGPYTLIVGSCFKNDDEKKNRVGQAILLVDVL